VIKEERSIFTIMEISPTSSEVDQISVQPINEENTSGNGTEENHSSIVQASTLSSSTTTSISVPHPLHSTVYLPRALGPSVNIYPLESYSFGVKEAILEKDGSVAARFSRMQEKFKEEGMRRSVDGVLLVHQHRHPHVLLLQIGNTFFKLPGGRLKPGEAEIEGLKKKLTSKIAATIAAYQPNWEIGELLCTWWRPHFEQQMYPYILPHISKPKECKRFYIVPLPSSCKFAVPKNLKLLAVPLFELYDNPQRYGPVISRLPEILGRFNFIYL
jgi:cleavage and polyadenylation specificity factor subunit 5